MAGPQYNTDMIRRLLHMAYKAAQASPDTSTQNGAILIAGPNGHLFTACNDLPTGVRARKERFERPLKYAYFDHAETGVIYAAAKAGCPTMESTMACTWAACAPCARAVVRSGVRRLIRHKIVEHDAREEWIKSILEGDTILREAGIEVIEFEERFNDPDLTIRFGGDIIMP